MQFTLPLPRSIFLPLIGFPLLFVPGISGGRIKLNSFVCFEVFLSSFHPFFFFSLFSFVAFRFSRFQRVWVAGVFMSCLSCPARWDGIASSTLLTALQCTWCSIYVSRVCDHGGCVSLLCVARMKISTDNGCVA